MSTNSGSTCDYRRERRSATVTDFPTAGPRDSGRRPLLCYAYANDPIIKWDFQRQGGLPGDPLLVLLLNDPDLKPADGLHSLPLTMDFGPVLGSMVARTGWNMGKNASDVVVEMKGGGYHFGNHQHFRRGEFPDLLSRSAGGRPGAIPLLRHAL